MSGLNFLNEGQNQLYQMVKNDWKGPKTRKFYLFYNAEFNPKTRVRKSSKSQIIVYSSDSRTVTKNVKKV